MGHNGCPRMGQDFENLPGRAEDLCNSEGVNLLLLRCGGKTERTGSVMIQAECHTFDDTSNSMQPLGLRRQMRRALFCWRPAVSRTMGCGCPRTPAGLW
jgi:hypothetical protein